MLETAVSVFAYERNTGTLVYAYNPDQELQPGTFTKIVAAIVALENGNLEDKVTVNSLSYKSLPAGATTAKPYLKEGEELTLKDLLHLMVLTWANDAAITVAEHISGTQEAFQFFLKPPGSHVILTQQHHGPFGFSAESCDHVAAVDLTDTGDSHALTVVQGGTHGFIFGNGFQ